MVATNLFIEINGLEQPLCSSKSLLVNSSGTSLLFTAVSKCICLKRELDKEWGTSIRGIQDVWLSSVVNSVRTITQLSEDKWHWLDCDHLEKDDLTAVQLLGIVKHKMNHNYVTEEKGMTEQAVGGDKERETMKKSEVKQRINKTANICKWIMSFYISNVMWTYLNFIKVALYYPQSIPKSQAQGKR